MTTYYIDLVNGSDAAAGTSWGTAWKTFTTGATAARLAPGDEVRVAETSAPTAIGTATWTSGKVGNSITFETAPTKQIDTCKSGWAGGNATVTNAQSTAYMTNTTFGGVTAGALQAVLSASIGRQCYKNLGSAQDFSAHQQVSFWFRTGTAIDTTGANSMQIVLCSDTAGNTPVDTLTMPKWNYAANIWYPIVIDKGSALGSSIQSVAFYSAGSSQTAATIYLDEMFASPASGLTLYSLIGLNDGDWHAIRSIRGADVQLLAGFVAGTAAGACSFNYQVDASWMGTTQTSTTYKLEPSRALLPTSGPAATFGIDDKEVATAALPHKFSGGWNTGTGLQTGVTFIDNGTQTASSVGINLLTNSYKYFENFGIVRFATGFTNTGNSVGKDLTFVANNTMPVIATTPSVTFMQSLVTNWGVTELGFKSASGNGSGAVPMFAHSYTSLPLNIGNIWGCGTTGTLLSFQATYNNGTTVNIGNVYPPAAGSNIVLALGGANMKYNIASIKVCSHAQTGIGIGFGGLSSATGSAVKIGTVSLTLGPGSAALFSNSSNNVLTIDTLEGSGTFIYAVCGASGAAGGENMVLIGSNTFSGTLFGSASTSLPNVKTYFHNWGGVTDVFRAYVGDSIQAVPGYFELQGTDVYTAGSKAVRFTGVTWAAGSQGAGCNLDLKLASAAAEANKLVTVTARVKRNSTAVAAGIYIPAFSKLVPGYTSDITAACASSGSYELLTITFTPTANCVFDVMAYLTVPVVGATPDIVWDALTISQAA
jgi:hypothetical protein